MLKVPMNRIMFYFFVAAEEEVCIAALNLICIISLLDSGIDFLFVPCVATNTRTAISIKFTGSVHFVHIPNQGFVLLNCLILCTV